MLCVHACVCTCVRGGMPEREKGNRGSTVRTLPACTVLGAHGAVSSARRFKVQSLCSGFVDGGVQLGDLTVLGTPQLFGLLFIFIISSFILNYNLWIFEGGDLGFQCGLEMQKTNKKKRAQRTSNNLTKAAHQ